MGEIGEERGIDLHGLAVSRHCGGGRCLNAGLGVLISGDSEGGSGGGGGLGSAAGRRRVAIGMDCLEPLPCLTTVHGAADAHKMSKRCRDWPSVARES